MSVPRLCRAAAAVLAATLLLALAPPASADTVSDEARVVQLVQQTRASVGAPALRVDSTLNSIARDWAAKMARDGYISHNVGIGSKVSASKLAENVGMGATVDIVHQGFLNSSGHRANMVDTGVSSLGVGVAYANGYVYVVQDYAQLNSTPPPPPPPPANRAPAVPAALTPVNSAVLRAAPTNASARYSDPDGNPGAVYLAVVDATGRVVRQQWSPVVCSGCLAGVSFPALSDGMYALYAVATDGKVASPMAAPTVFTVNRSAPLAPAQLQRVGANAAAVYSDPDGSPGWLYVYVYGPGNTLLSHGWTARVCSGCTATYPLPALGHGTYNLYAVAYDGLGSPAAGPVPFVA